jgi:hypothetical protein
MEHLGISNTVDNTGGFWIAGVATADVSLCVGFSVWYVERPMRKLATNIFDISVLIVGVCLNVYFIITESKYSFFYIRG